MEFTDYHTRLGAYALLVDEEHVGGQPGVVFGEVHAHVPFVSASASSRLKRPS